MDRRFVLFLIILTSRYDSQINGLAETSAFCNDETWCSSLTETEKISLEAIRLLHQKLDDDKNGNIDFAEANDFLREELEYEKDYEKRQNVFHKNYDFEVSLKELWQGWIASDVHEWNVDQTVVWLCDFVGLNHLENRFRELEINGSCLPQIAVNYHNYISSRIGVKDSKNFKKLLVKAQDVVLFGPPKVHDSYIKDVIFAIIVVSITIGSYVNYIKYKKSEANVALMTKHLADLSKAEKDLQELQKKVEESSQRKEMPIGSNTLTSQDSSDQESTGISDDDPQILALKEEIKMLKDELKRANEELSERCWTAPVSLVQWLQLTYELETRWYNKRKAIAERQLTQAKEACDKLKKKRSSLIGAFVSTHGRSIDEVDKAILEARAALTEVTYELSERVQRWNQIENLANCNVVSNPGMSSLEAQLRTVGRHSQPASLIGTSGFATNTSLDEIEDDVASSVYCPSSVGCTFNAGLTRSRSTNSVRDRLRDPSMEEDSDNGDSRRDRKVKFGLNNSRTEEAQETSGNSSRKSKDDARKKPVQVLSGYERKREIETANAAIDPIVPESLVVSDTLDDSHDDIFSDALQLDDFFSSEDQLYTHEEEPTISDAALRSGVDALPTDNLMPPTATLPSGSTSVDKSSLSSNTPVLIKSSTKPRKPPRKVAHTSDGGRFWRKKSNKCQLDTQTSAPVHAEPNNEVNIDGNRRPRRSFSRKIKDELRRFTGKQKKAHIRNPHNPEN